MNFCYVRPESKNSNYFGHLQRNLQTIHYSRKNIVFDAIQDAFLTLICKSPPINESTFIPIFKKIVYYNILKYLRRKKEQCIDPNELDKILQYNPDYYAKEEGNELYSEQLYSILIQAKQGLKESEARLITLRYWENKTFKEIGAIMGLTEAAAQKRHVRILQKLRTKILDLCKKLDVAPPPCTSKIVPNINFVRKFLILDYIY